MWQMKNCSVFEINLTLPPQKKTPTNHLHMMHYVRLIHLTILYVNCIKQLWYNRILMNVNYYEKPRFLSEF